MTALREDDLYHKQDRDRDDDIQALLFQQEEDMEFYKEHEMAKAMEFALNKIFKY